MSPVTEVTEPLRISIASLQPVMNFLIGSHNGEVLLSVTVVG
jgi:hypothetical protein